MGVGSQYQGIVVLLPPAREGELASILDSICFSIFSCESFAVFIQ